MTCSTSYVLYYTRMDPWNVRMHFCVCVFVGLYVYYRTVSKSVSTSTSNVPSDPLPSSLSSCSPMTTPDPQSDNLSIFLKETVRTP